MANKPELSKKLKYWKMRGIFFYFQEVYFERNGSRMQDFRAVKIAEIVAHLNLSKLPHYEVSRLL